MGKREIREPSQKRSIEKKEKIIQAGFKLMCKKGFHNTNTVEIAREADVSTGIVYQYFKDKRDIFLYGIEQYAKDLMFPICSIKDRDIDLKNLSKEFYEIINSSVKKHSLSKKAHEEIVALQHQDKEVEQIFENYELEASESLVTALKNSGLNAKNLEEKSHIIVSMIDSLCHELVYHKHKDMDYDVMSKLVVDSIVFLLKA